VAGRGNKKTTMAKLNRENRQREKRQQKNARKEARKSGVDDDAATTAEGDEPVEEAWQLTRGLDPDQL
jgi:hypothetical protein